jgi:hypothetical protein
VFLTPGKGSLIVAHWVKDSLWKAIRALIHTISELGIGKDLGIGKPPWAGVLTLLPSPTSLRTCSSRALIRQILFVGRAHLPMRWVLTLTGFGGCRQTSLQLGNTKPLIGSQSTPLARPEWNHSLTVALICARSVNQ